MKNRIKNVVLSLMSAAFISFSLICSAEDIDIIDTEKNTIPPNILFVLDGSESMGTLVGSTGVSRMDTVKNALKTLISSPDTENMNIGVMSFSNTITDGGVVTPYDASHYVHGPAYPVSPIDGDTDNDGTPDQTAEDVLRLNTNFTNLSNSYLPAVTATENTRTYTQKVIDQWSTGGGTPIVGALFEAAKYMRGDYIQWGNLPPDRIESAHPSTYTGGFIADGSVSSSTTCSSAAGVESCDKNTTCQASRNFSCTFTNGASYLSTTDVPSDSCIANNMSPTVNCSKGTSVCGAAATSAECTFTTVPEKVVSNSFCSTGTTVAACNAVPNLSNCVDKSAEGSSVASIYCDKTIAAWDKYQCPDTPPAEPFTCYTQVEKCTQDRQSCKTESKSDLVYNSPINAECQNNAIILLSDGAPTVNKSATMVTNMIGDPIASGCKNISPPTDSYDWTSKSAIDYYGRCGTELASFLANTDNSNSSIGHDIAGDQPINLFTIGFDLASEPDAQQYLDDLAAAGGGSSYTAGDEANLIAAFKGAISGTNKKARVFSSPTYQVSSTNSLLHGSSVYLPMFNTQGGPRWTGNLKKFNQVSGVLKDKDGNDVIDSDGQYSVTAKDLWSDATSTHTHAVTDGGAANKIIRASRKILTDDGSKVVALNATNVSEAQLGLATGDPEKTALITYAKGYEADGVTPRHAMGDIIHSKPIYFSYDGLTRTKTGGVVFVGTNEGYLHAINDIDGTEAFAYMPQELLKNLKTLKDKDIDSTHLYGVDGPITLRFDDINNNGEVDTADGDKVILYFGLRRGGKSYYALDVTNPDSPDLLNNNWPITAGGDFDELGFSWSKPKLAKMKVGSTEKSVLIFGGGYVDDNANEADNSGTGSSVYIVDADNGSLIWKPEKATIEYAVAGNIRNVDVNRDGLVDRLYFGDTGGNIWRVDLNETAYPNSTYDKVKARITHFADLGSVLSPATTVRKFFNEPDVAIFRRNGKLSMSIAIGSGDRANPLDPNGDDRFFVLFDKYVLNLPKTAPDPLDLSDLGTPGSIEEDGWNLDLTVMGGEKVLSTALTFQSKIMFTTFGKGSTVTLPTAANNCSAGSSNQSRIYVLNLLNGDPVYDLSKDPLDPANAPLDDDDRSIIAKPDGMILDTPPPVFDKTTAEDGTACVKGDCKRVFAIPGVTTNDSEGAGSLPRVFWIDKD